MKCNLDAEGHCITCSDEALPARVLRIDQDTGVAFVTIAESTEEVDITLIDDVVAGDVILVHGGVAIAIAESTPCIVGAGLAPALAPNGPLAPALAPNGPLAPALAPFGAGLAPTLANNEANDA
jgi:hydrogenase maturation factor